tara:strand:+ start:1478 stop:2206 length:729 start_codon:yes stop_codon:yes gene_type:complete
MPKPLEYFEKFYKYAPYVGAGLTGLAALKAPENMRSLGGWLSGETYTGDAGRGFQYGDTSASRYTDTGKGGAFGGFEGTARDYLTNKGYSWAGNLAGDTVNLLGEILSSPIELGFRARDEVQGFLGANPGVERLRKTAGEVIGAYQQVQGGKPKGEDPRREQKRIAHKKANYGSPAQMRQLSNARKMQNQKVGGVYDQDVAQLLQYALHQLDPTRSEEVKSRKTMGVVSTGGQTIGRGRGIG